MNIRFLPLPKGGRRRVGGSILRTIGRFSRPFLKQILRIGLNKLKEKAISKIRRGGENLTKLATMQPSQQQTNQLTNKPAKIGGYKVPEAPKQLIHSPLEVGTSQIIRKRRSKKKRSTSYAFNVQSGTDKNERKS